MTGEEKGEEMEDGKYWEGGRILGYINEVTGAGCEEEDRGLMEKYKSW